MNIKLFHSFNSELSRKLMSDLGVDPLVEETCANFNGMVIDIVSSPFMLGNHSVRVAPTVFYTDTSNVTHSLEFPYNWEAVKLWADQIERSL